MLTIEMLQQNPALAGLSQEHLSAIAEMSKNDENTVIGAKIGALHGQYDTDTFDITGIKKNDGEKSYDYLKRVLNKYKQESDNVKNIKSELEAAKVQVTDLQAKLEKGVSDEVLTKQIKDAKAQVTQLQAQLRTKQSELDTKQTEFDKQLKNIHVDYAFNEAVSTLKFKAGITEAVQKTLINAAKSEILSKGSPDFIESENGNKKLVMRGADGNILNNPSNNLNPYTLQELVLETSLKDVIETGRRQQGGGTGSGGFRSSQRTETIDLSSARTQVEADKAIESYLLSLGLTRDSSEFGEKLITIRTENNVAELPIR